MEKGLLGKAIECHLPEIIFHVDLEFAPYLDHFTKGFQSTLAGRVAADQINRTINGLNDLEKIDF